MDIGIIIASSIYIVVEMKTRFSLVGGFGLRVWFEELLKYLGRASFISPPILKGSQDKPYISDCHKNNLNTSLQDLFTQTPRQTI